MCVCVSHFFSLSAGLGVRSYLKEALVSIISVHAEVSYYMKPSLTSDLPQP